VPRAFCSLRLASAVLRVFDSLEVSSTFHEIPSRGVLNDWALQTPKGFFFSVKVPKVITHDKVLLDCDAEFAQFLDAVSKLDDKLNEEASQSAKPSA
jgi:uncharacterized protein YecE (DUF72 family)